MRSKWIFTVAIVICCDDWMNLGKPFEFRQGHPSGGYWSPVPSLNVIVWGIFRQWAVRVEHLNQEQGQTLRSGHNRPRKKMAGMECGPSWQYPGAVGWAQTEPECFPPSLGRNPWLILGVLPQTRTLLVLISRLRMDLECCVLALVNCVSYNKE